MAAGPVGKFAQAAHGDGVRWPPTPGIQGLEQFPASAVGQGNVAQEQVEGLLLGQCERLRLVLGEGRPAAQGLEKHLDPPARIGMVFDDQDVQRFQSLTRGRPSAAATACGVFWHRFTDSPREPPHAGSISIFRQKDAVTG